ncbi:MAG: hypothetical protein RI953_1302, partial [Pseudomonadota bacterium]
CKHLLSSISAFSHAEFFPKSELLITLHFNFLWSSFLGLDQFKDCDYDWS